MRNSTRFFSLVLLTALFYLPSAAQSYVQVGTGNEQSSQPFYTSWKYSYTSIIYTKAELGAAKSITGLAFNNNFTDLVSQGFDFDMPNQKLWIKHVPQEEWTFTSGQSPYENPSVNGYTLVWQGTYHYGALGWMPITFTTPFEYNGTDNIAFHWENGSGTSAYSLKTAATVVGKKQVKSGGSDASIPNTSGYENYPFGNKVNARFIYDAGDVPANPELTSPANSKIKTDLNSALKFSLGTNTTSYDLFFGTDQNALVKVVDNAVVTQVGEVIFTPATLLQANTTYYWQVIAKNATATSESSVYSFKTQEIIALFPYLQDFEANWISNIDPLHPDTLNSVINTNYPDQTPWSWDNNWNAIKGKTIAYQGLFSAYISTFSDGNYSLTSPRFNLPANMRVSFWWKNGYTAPTRVGAADTTYFEVSNDGKATWKTLLKLCGPADMKAYDNAVADLSELAGENVYMRWRYRRFGATAKQFYLDNVKVEATPNGATIVMDYADLNYPSIVPAGKSKRKVIIYNTGSGNLVVTGITTNGPYTCDFNKTIASNKKDTATIYFTPTAVGTFNSTVTFNVGGASGNASILCHGTAIASMDKYFQNFDAVKAIPAGWVAIQSSKANTIVQNIFPVNYVSDVYSAPNAMKMVRINDSDTLDPVILVGPGVTGFAENKLSFYARKGGVEYGLELIVGVMDDPNDASTFIPKQTVTLTETYTQYTVKFKANNAQPYIAFKYGEYTPKKPFPFTSLRIEDISWEPDVVAPPAAAQIGAPVNEVDSVDIMSGLKVRWAAGSANTNGFKLYIGTTAASCNEIVDGLDVSKDKPNYTITFDKLAYNTKYFWKVVPYNENGNCPDPLTWSFTSMANPLVTIYPFTEGFDKTLNISGEFDKPLGWNIQDVNGDRSTWDMVCYPPAMQGFTHNDSKGAIHVAFHPFNAKDEWLFTPPMQMKKGYQYDLEFYIHTLMDYSTGSFYKEEISVWAGSGRANTGMTDSLTYEVVNDNEWKKVVTSFKPTQDGVYYLGFHAISKAAQYVIIVDDVTIAEKNITGVENPEADKTLKVYPNPATDYVNFELPSSITGSAKVTVIDVLGKVVRRENVGESRVVNLSGLNNGAYLLKVEADGKSFIRKVFVKK
ncbi:T9SS-dependent choice-of-anchor J family protein [Williamwhitmania taraxaci]|uniref:Por secretion system C-terminal sorting domain-containing protein n=1 Tax=Williamwhitmania taraxaci TaxID=1640674 RepID=A0A1G6PCF6_9BACT|nr:choice-of-anchor J domain-containing protein [Williamwhitmania taraxaci]SDC77236.1 Por secretion system C-terminal sorting domain-containing protein [Williamwhitmania taraxaci]